MASVSSKTDQIVDEKLDDKKEADDSKSGGEENTLTYSATVSEEKPESENVSIVEGLEKSEKTNVDSNPPASIEVNVKDLRDEAAIPPASTEVNVKDLRDEAAIPEEQKKESSDAVVPDVSEATENDQLNAEVSVNDLLVQSAFPEEQKQEKVTETQEPGSDGAPSISRGKVVQSSSLEEKDSGDAEAVQEKEESLEEEITENPLETFEAKTEVAQNSADLSAAEGPSDQGEAPITAEIVEKDIRFSTEKEGIEATVKDPNIVPEASEVLSKNKEVSASDEKESESLKDEDVTSVKAPKYFTTVEESPEQLIENKNESSKNDKDVPAETSNDFETPEFAAEVVKDIGLSEMVEGKKNDYKNQSAVEKNVPISDEKKEETQIEEAIQIATDKSEKKELGAEKEESDKSKDVVDPIVSYDTSETKLIEEPTKREPNNLLSKVKRSIVKAKKAILGKSPAGPKTVSSEIKDDNA